LYIKRKRVKEDLSTLVIVIFARTKSAWFIFSDELIRSEISRFQNRACQRRHVNSIVREQRGSW